MQDVYCMCMPLSTPSLFQPEPSLSSHLHSLLPLLRPCHERKHRRLAIHPCTLQYMHMASPPAALQAGQLPVHCPHVTQACMLAVHAYCTCMLTVQQYGPQHVYAARTCRRGDSGTLAAPSSMSERNLQRMHACSGEGAQRRSNTSINYAYMCCRAVILPLTPTQPNTCTHACMPLPTPRNTHACPCSPLLLPHLHANARLLGQHARKRHHASGKLHGRVPATHSHYA